MSLEIFDFELELRGKSSLTHLKIPRLCLKQGQFYHLQGPSGTGKSLFLKSLARLHPFTGKLRINETYHDALDLKKWRVQVSYLNSMPVIFSKSIRDNLEIGFKNRENSELPLPQSKEMERLLESFGLSQWSLDSSASRLSQGEKSRIQILRHLLLKPSWVFMDESLNSLDEETRKKVLDNLKILVNQGQMGVLIVHHGDLPMPMIPLVLENGTIHE
jgi:putative ABC transport system ATP-binding protein